MNNPTPQELVEHALATSQNDDCIAIVRSTTSANLRWANNTLTTNGVMAEVAMSVVSFHLTSTGTSTGSVTGNVSTLEQATTLVEAADAAARGAKDAEDIAELIGDHTSADWSQPPASTDIGVYADFAPALGREFGRADAAGRILYGFVNHDITTTYLGSTRGLRLRHVQPTGHYACTAKDSGLTQSAWVGGATRDFADVDAHQVVDEVSTRLQWGRRRLELPAGRYDTILPPSSVADLMIDAYWAAGARVAHEGESAYSRPSGGTRIGEQLVRAGVDLYSDPAYPGLECIPWAATSASDNTESVFDNGLPLERTHWLRDGKLESLIQTRHSATLTGQETTPFIDNLILDVDGATGSIDDLVASTERGLLVTCLWYIREVDPQTMLLTGLTRDGVYLVEDGAVVGMVNNFRWNESPIDLLSRFSAASSTQLSFSREWGDDYFSRTATPALRIPDFNMSSVSPGV